MSSWIIAKNISLKKKSAVISDYYSTSDSFDIPSIYMDTVAAYIYYQKMGTQCSIWDPTGIILTSLNYNPQVNILKESPGTNSTPLSTYESVVSIPFKQIQKYSNTILVYKPAFRDAIAKIIQKVSTRQGFDFGLHISTNTPNDIVKTYIDIIKAYQTKAKKASLSIYLMADSDTVKEFQSLGDVSWKVTSLSKHAPKDAADGFLHMMGDIHILSEVPAIALDFNQSIDRFIYLIQTNPLGYNFFKELNDQPWRLIYQPNKILNVNINV